MTARPADADFFVESLLDWAAEHGRSYPWRETDDPYRILISEVLLRRSRGTTVAKVVDLFFARWPSADALANADEDEVVDVIRPLGLTRRSAQLVALGAKLSEAAEFPRTAEMLRELPGVGEYAARCTVGEPVVDGTSARVFRRYFGWLEAPEHKTVDEELWRLASQVYPGDESRARGLNWAALDLAAAVCLPQRPRCSACPLQTACYYGSETATGIGEQYGLMGGVDPHGQDI